MNLTIAAIVILACLVAWSLVRECPRCKERDQLDADKWQRFADSSCVCPTCGHLHPDRT